MTPYRMEPPDSVCDPPGIQLLELSSASLAALQVALVSLFWLRPSSQGKAFLSHVPSKVHLSQSC